MRASDVKIRFKSFLPGAGRDSAGDPKQGKTRVVGEVDVTSYSGGSGEPLSAVDLGLLTVDSINLRVAEAVPGDFSGSGVTRDVAYAKGSGHFYLFTTDEAGTRVNYAVASTETLEFDVSGDSANDVELT